MNVLALEENDRISKIFEKIFLKKNINAKIAKSQEECFEEFQKMILNKENVDFIILDKSQMLDNEKRLEDKILELKPAQKLFFLSPYLNLEFDGKIPESALIIHKPFALITLLTKLELKVPDNIIVKTV
jgi:hypothetical protein